MSHYNLYPHQIEKGLESKFHESVFIWWHSATCIQKWVVSKSFSDCMWSLVFVLWRMAKISLRLNFVISCSRLSRLQGIAARWNFMSRNFQWIRRTSIPIADAHAPLGQCWQKFSIMLISLGDISGKNIFAHWITY